MTTQVKDIRPAKNITLVRELVKTVEAIGKQLKPVLDECLRTHSSSRVKESLQKLLSLATACTTASKTFEDRLDVVVNHAASGHMKWSGDLQLRNQEFLSTQLRQLAEFQSDKHLLATGFGAHDAAAKAKEIAAEHTKTTDQIGIGLEVLKIAVGLVAHTPIALFETGKAAKDLVASTKSTKFEQEIEKLAGELEAIGKLENQLEDMCLFLYLVPELLDLQGTGVVDEETARIRLRANI